METGEEETEVDVGTDELVDAAPVVESPCHCEQLATVSRGLLRYASGCKGSPRDVTAAAAAAAVAAAANTTSRGCGPKTRGSMFSAVEFRKWCSSRPGRPNSPLYFQCLRDLTWKSNDCV